MDTRSYLRIEGASVFVAATAAFFLVIDAPWWLYLLVVLAPDLSMLGYLAGPRRGALAYNLVHVYVGPLALAGVGWMLGVPFALPAAAVWAAHVGADRAMGYGLKAETGFHDTHLGRIGRGTDAGPAID